jgi:hypothetical protein
MKPTDLTRRRLMIGSLAIPLLSGLDGCAAPLAPLGNPSSAEEAHALLLRSAEAHGLAAFQAIGDVNVRYEGKWRPVVGRLQPALVDAKFRGGSEERLLLGSGVVAQAHTGPHGRKHVTRKTRIGSAGDVRVWFNGEEDSDRDRRAAAALVVDGYGLFLLGPLLLADRWRVERAISLDMSGTAVLRLDGRTHACDVVRLRMTPGLGFSEADDMAVFIDRDDGLMRCVRFSLNGLESTRAAIAEVQTFDHVNLHGVNWPTRFHERLLRPVPLPVHDWRLVGLDLNRGLTPDELDGDAFRGKAIGAATSLA